SAGSGTTGASRVGSASSSATWVRSDTTSIDTVPTDAGVTGATEAGVATTAPSVTCSSSSGGSCCSAGSSIETVRLSGSAAARAASPSSERAPSCSGSCPAVFRTMRVTLLDHDQQVSGVDLPCGGDREAFHGAGDGARDGRLHLHRLDGRDGGARVDAIALLDLQGHDPREGRRDVAGLARIRLLGARGLDGDRAVAHEHGAQLAVERRHDGAHALVVGFADGLESDEEAHARADLHGVLGTRLEAVEVVDGVEGRQVAVLIAHVLELLGRACEEQAVERGASLRGVAGQPGLLLRGERLEA